MSDAAFGTWFSRIIRWLLAAGFGYVAYKNEDFSILYLFAAVAFITSFMTPKRCIEDSCNLPDKDANC
jgi:hypothetical protein